MKASFASILPLVGLAICHGTVPYFKVDGKVQQGFLLDYYWLIQNGGTPPDVAGWYAENTDNGFVSPANYGTSDINCHINSKPGAATSSVSAGGTVDFLWTSWPDSHKGPIFTYIAECSGSCTSADKTQLKWVKIDEDAINLSTQEWATSKLMANNNTWTTTVPSNLKAGNYVFRHEIIAMHGAGSENGAQNYPQCFNIQVTGSGTTSLPAGTLGTALYKSDDPGILFNPYTTLTSYEIPGPALWTGASKKRSHARDLA